jgi:guanylate cyclase soluble subunit beta
MYGMVNQAIKSMVLENFGPSMWESVCQKASLQTRDFTPFEQYDDNITGNIVVTISELTNIKAEDLLEAFGIYWVEYAKRSEYNSILVSFATSPIALIESLDSLHSRLQLLFSELSAPSFWVEHSAPNEIIVHYSTIRKDMPLEFFVVGLLKGVFKMFNQTCTVVMLQGDNEEKAKFQVRY